MQHLYSVEVVIHHQSSRITKLCCCVEVVAVGTSRGQYSMTLLILDANTLFFFIIWNIAKIMCSYSHVSVWLVYCHFFCFVFIHFWLFSQIEKKVVSFCVLTHLPKKRIPFLPLAFFFPIWSIFVFCFFSFSHLFFPLNLWLTSHLLYRNQAVFFNL